MLSWNELNDKKKCNYIKECESLIDFRDEIQTKRINTNVIVFMLRQFKDIVAPSCPVSMIRVF